ncbi:hypothetical protein [Streptomyces sp. ALB3]|uniref:hypothetical protein n=1 Tax=Streptomyces sp. ALB3 TaxID=3374278 RepID=UPI0037A42D2C
MNRSTMDLLLSAQEDTMRDVRRLLRAKAMKARGLWKESDGKALGDAGLEKQGRDARTAARDMERGGRTDGTRDV